MSDFKREFKSFMDDIEQNIKNEEDLQYIKGRTADLFGVLLDEMERILNYKEEKMAILMRNQQEMGAKMDKMEQVMNNIEKDIYSDEGFDFEIVCPYCNCEFIIDFDENRTEIECPECNNAIELDWTGGEQEDECLGGNCDSCPGCGENNEKEDNQDDM